MSERLTPDMEREIWDRVEREVPQSVVNPFWKRCIRDRAALLAELGRLRARIEEQDFAGDDRCRELTELRAQLAESQANAREVELLRDLERYMRTRQQLNMQGVLWNLVDHSLSALDAHRKERSNAD